MTHQQLLLQDQTPAAEDKNTQRKRILDLLRSADTVSLPLILELKIANYRARISELRQQGWRIDCETAWVNGQRHSRYRLWLNTTRRA